MKVADVCKSYFNGFQEVSTIKENSTSKNVLAWLKIISYFSVIIPLAFAALYGAASLYGRVHKNDELSSQDKKIGGKAKQIISKDAVSKIKAFNQKIIRSAKAYRSRVKAENQKALKAEIDRFNNYVKEANVGSHDIVYVCLGAGQQLGQVWPGFIFEALEKGQKVKTLVFEQLYFDMTFHFPEGDFYDRMKGIYREFYKPIEGEVPFLKDLENNYEFQQFLCGYPDMEKSEETADPKIYPIASDVFWPTKEQITQARSAFEEYIRKEVQAGKTVIFGDHRAAIDADKVKLYNKLVRKYPGQVHFLWGWHGCNLMTDALISKEDRIPTKRGAPWVYYEHLGKCVLG